MLARASSDAGTRLRRSKSASTVHRRPPSISEPPHPDYIQQQALAAATAAYARAQAHDVADRKAKRSSDMTRSKSSTSRKSLTSQGSHFPPRESSLRSMEPRKTGAVANTSRQSRASTLDTEQFPPFYPILSSEQPASAPRPLSAQPSITFSDNTRPSSQAKMLRQSASSSITSQQIRKARSMYYASSIQTGSPIARPPAKYLTTPPAASTSPAPEPTSVLPPNRTLRPSPLVPPRIPITVAADETVDQARDKYLQGFQQKTVKHKPSVFLAPFKKRQDKGKDKGKHVTSGAHSLASASHRTPGQSTTDVTVADFQPQHEPKEKRSFSGSLKSKFKKVFRRTSNRSPTLPVQQIDASREYFSSIHVSPPVPSEVYDIPSPDRETLKRVRSRTPSAEGFHPVYSRIGSRTSSNGSSKSDKSNRSLHSETNATQVSSSRVTSWGTNSTGDTLTQRAMKRLTVIHEAKDSIGSEADRIASMVPRRKSLPPLAAFRDPMPMESLMEESLTPVDPKRVFSALMKEIDVSKSPQASSSRVDRTPGAESDVFESSATKELHSQALELQSSAGREAKPSTNSDQRSLVRRPASAAAQSAQSAQSKSSTIRSFGRAIRSTIRTVTPAQQHSSPWAATNPEKNSEDLPSTTPPGSEGSMQEISPEFFTPSAAQIEERVAKSDNRWKTPLEDVETLQFPRQTDRTYNVTNFVQHSSKYTACNSDPDQDEGPHIELYKPTMKSTFLPPESPRPVSPAPRPLMSPLSPSVYSRDTDGISILPNDSVMSFNRPDELERVHDGGSAVILTSQSFRSYVIGTPSPRRPDSTETSRDWKAWLSHEISGMERVSNEDLRIHEQYVTPPGRHRRDTARTSHTEHDDTTVILRESCDMSTPRPNAETPTAASKHTLLSDSEAITNYQTSTSDAKKAAFENTDSHRDTFKEVSPTHTPRTPGSTEPSQYQSQGGSTPILRKHLVPSTPSPHASTSQDVIETPRSSPMNERFPYISRIRRSSNNSASSSQHSKSPADSVGSLKSAKSSKAPSPIIYSDVSAPHPNEASQRILNTALKRSDAMCKRKENITPPRMLSSGKSIDLPLSVTSRKSLQPLSAAALNQNQSNSDHHTKNNSSPAAPSPGPRIRAALRPISPEKLARRPRSAFDLRGAGASQGPRSLYQTNIVEFKIPVTRPASELRRPALTIKTSTSSLAQAKEPAPIAEERVISSVLEDAQEGSVTPGQRMVDRFLKERKSTGILESGKMRGGLKLAREDTPAFL